MERPDDPPDEASAEILQLHKAAKEAYDIAIMVEREYRNARSNAKQYKSEYDRAVRELLQARLF